MAEGPPKVSILDFFNPSKKLPEIYIQRGQTDGRCVPSGEFAVKTPFQRERSQGFSYVEEFKNKQLEQRFEEIRVPSAVDETGDAKPATMQRSMLDVDGISTLGGSRLDHEVDEDDLAAVYTKYDLTPTQPKGLLIEDYKSEILRMVDSNQVVVIEGATGCGKSTQVPQYILDQHASRNVYCNIVVTQPRRIAATSIARRVCEERNWNLGTLVGYQIGLDGKHSPDTRLLFCTTGVLLQKLINLKDMNKYTHVILDEVHERNQDMDFLMILVRKLLRSNSRNVKVILMSATFDTARFSDYFAVPVNNTLAGAPIIDVKVLSQHKRFNVYEHYLDDLYKSDKYGRFPEMGVKEDDPCIPPEAYQICEQLIRAYFQSHDEADSGIRRRDGENKPREFTRHCVLVFLPGLSAIEDMYKVLDRNNPENEKKWQIIPLHSSLTREEQGRVFLPAKPGHRKIILCTDIAESSITVPDVKYVIDFCLSKDLIADPQTNFTSLKLTWASRTNCKQRAGRTGRVMDGRVYRLVPKNFYYGVLKEEKIPEMLRCPLEVLVLKCKILDAGEPRAILSLALDPPDVSNIERAILLLKEAGGLLNTCRGRPMQFDGDITYLGRIMAVLPVNINISKLIFWGYMFSMLEETIIIGATMSAQNIFTTPFREQLKNYNTKLRWADSSCCDAIAHLNAYKLHKEYTRTGFFDSTARNNKKWADVRFVNLKGLHEANELIVDITMRLRNLNITAESSEGTVHWNRVDKPLIMKVIIAGAFYPNYFLRGEQGGQVNEREALRKVGGHDAKRSVFLTGLPDDQPGALYAQAVKDSLRECGTKIKVFHDSNKFIVEFGDDPDRNDEPPIPGDINMSVYSAVKRRIANLPVIVNLVRPVEAKRRAASLGLLPMAIQFRNLEAQPSQQSLVVPMFQTAVTFNVCEIQNPGKFWIHLEENKEDIDSLFRFINEQSNLGSLKTSPKVGDIVAAPYRSIDGVLGYYRARVEGLSRNCNNVPQAEVYFMDYGCTARFLIPALKSVVDMPSLMWNKPPLAVECRLAGLRPSLFSNKDGIWSEEATEYFKSLVAGQALLVGHVFSFVDDVLALEVNTTSSSRSLNEILVREGYAGVCEEDIRSKADNASRIEAASSGLATDYSHAFGVPQEITAESPSRAESYREAVLRGPFSPLEMKVFGCTRSTIGKDVRLDGNSVNAVLLDAYPQDRHERLLVAATVTQPGISRLVIRNTTFFPNVQGLASLMGLLFAPYVELILDKAETKYIGMLCGLGHDNGCPLFPENDLSMTFDCAFDEEDIDCVNKIRYWMSTLMRTDEGESLPSISLGDRRQAQIKLQENLLQLVKRRRASQALSFDRPVFKWGFYDESEMSVVASDDDRFVFKLIKKPKLCTSDDIVNHFIELYDICKSPPETPIDVLCKGCKVHVTSVSELRDHLKTSAHRRKEADTMDKERNEPPSASEASRV